MAELNEITCKSLGNPNHSFELDSKAKGWIKDFISEYNKRSFPNDKRFPEFSFLLVYHGFQDLFRNGSYDFSQGDTFSKNDSNTTPIPIVHVTPFDVFEEFVGQDDREEERGMVEAVRRCKKIMDSSIWNFYVPVFPSLHEVSKEKIDFKLFHKVLQHIAFNTERGLYNLAVSNEYADLNARLVSESKLNGSHKAISPFLFHSEKEMQDNVKVILNNKEVLTDIKAYRWRFLLLDDKSFDNMKLVKKNQLIINKLQIISNNLNRILGFDKEKIWFRRRILDNLSFEHYGRVVDGSWKSKAYPGSVEDMQVVIDCATNIKEAKQCMQNYEYEIILLDYLLNQEYGYCLLKEFKENSNHYRIGPYNRSFFMFISAFTTAVQERLLEQGFNRSERGLWFIGDGACPTNTPYLFSYQLLLRMQHRLSDLRREHEGGFNTIIDLLKHVYVEKSTFNDVRANAKDHFNDVLYMRNKYHQLEKDLSSEEEKELIGTCKNDASYIMTMKSSLLVHSIFKVIHLFSGAFFEHLQHLVYLTAFGTIRQWEELWEEYVFVHNELEEYDRLMSDQIKKIECKEGHHISDAIRNYVIKLKENAY